MDWLHWIGNSYYSIASFIKEAERLGVSRRVPSNVIKKMDFGDRIYCISREPNLKSPVVFGYYDITKFQGLHIDWGKVPDHLQPRTIEASPFSIQERGCGTIREGGLYAIGIPSVKKLESYVSSVDGDPLAQGALVVYPKPWPMMPTIKPFRGFRPFKGDDFVKALPAGTDKRPKIKGGFYI